MKKFFYSCLVDDNDVFRKQCLLWIASLCTYCNVAADSLYVHLCGEQPDFAQHLEKLSVHVVRAQKFGDHRYLNKFSQFSTEELCQADYIVLCDCDTAFLKSIEPMVGEEAVYGKIADMPQPPVDILKEIYTFFSLDVPVQAKTLSHMTLSTYLNGGLYIIPQAYFAQIGAYAKDFALQILQSSYLNELIGKNIHHTDQLAFSLAIQKAKCRLHLLPLEYNFPLHIFYYIEKNFPQQKVEGLSEIYVMHHHQNVLDNKQFAMTGNDVINSAIVKVNKLLSDMM